MVRGWRKGARLRRRRPRLLLVVPAILLAAGAFAVASVLAAAPTIEAAFGPSGYTWSPSGAQIATGGSINFKNSSGIPHGVSWSGGPATPSCSGVPINEGKGSLERQLLLLAAWDLHVQMPHPPHRNDRHHHRHLGRGGRTADSDSDARAASPPPGESGPAAHDLRIAGNQRGSVVRGSIEIAGSATGSKLEVLLLARRAALLGPGHAGMANVGRLVRASTGTGHTSFSLRLNEAGRRALRRSRPPASLDQGLRHAPDGRGIEVHAFDHRQ